MSRWALVKCKTTGESSSSDSLVRLGSLAIWFASTMIWASQPTGKRYRQQQFSYAAIET